MQSSNLEQYRKARHDHVAQYVETDCHDHIQEIAGAYDSGYQHGHGIACHNIPTLGETYWTDCDGKLTADADNIRDIHQSLCFEAESNARCFSPWEFIAHDINTAAPEGDDWLTEVLWDSYDAGVADAIAHDLETYTDEDYGLEVTS